MGDGNEVLLMRKKKDNNGESALLTAVWFSKSYEALVEFVEKEPLNQTVVIDSHENIKPFVYAGLKRQKEESKL